MKFQEITKMKEPELQQKLVELRRQLLKDKTEIAKGSQVKNRGQITVTKKTIARILTLLNQQKLQKEGTKG